MTVGNSERDSQRQAAERVLEDGLVVDLTRPPSREELAVPDGRTSTVLQRRDREPFDTTVRFHDGHELRTQGAVLIVTAKSGDGPPTSMTVRRDKMSLADLQTALDTAVDELGADRDRADAVLAAARRATSGRADVIRVLPTAVRSPDRLEVESVVTAREGHVSVNYLVSWGDDE